MVETARHYQAELGEDIYSFARELVKMRKEIACDIVGNFNDVNINVNENTTEDEIVKAYQSHVFEI